MAEDLIEEIDVRTTDRKSQITIVGVGGAGGNAVNYMQQVGIAGVTFMVCNTDSQALAKSPVEFKIQMGPGNGAGNDPAVGRDLATMSLDDVRNKLESLGTQMIFIAAGMGGGTGTGASPVIAKLAHEMGILTVAIVTLPLLAEGMLRYEQAKKGIEELREWVDSLLILNNNNLSKLGPRMSMEQAFNKANDVLALAAKGIAEIITVPSDMVNVDFADVRKVLTNSGRAHMSVATATGDDRAEEAVAASLQSPLLDNHLIKGAKDILLNISVASRDSLMLDEVERILACVQEYASERRDRPTANIIWGSSYKPELKDALEVIIVATGFGSKADSDEPEPSMPPVRPPKPETLGGDESERIIPARHSNRYESVNSLLEVPAYRRRNMQFDIEKRPALRRESLRDGTDDSLQNDSSLFGNGTAE